MPGALIPCPTVRSKHGKIIELTHSDNSLQDLNRQSHSFYPYQPSRNKTGLHISSWLIKIAGFHSLSVLLHPEIHTSLSPLLLPSSAFQPYLPWLRRKWVKSCQGPISRTKSKAQKGALSFPNGVPALNPAIYNVLFSNKANTPGWH